MPDYISNGALIVTFILSALNLWDRITLKLKAAKMPTKVLENRIDALEELLKVKYAQRFKTDLERIEQIEEGNKVTQKALLALLSHARDGNNTEQIVKAENELTQYLIDR